MSAIGGPQVNKFEQVPGLGYQMSLAKSGCAGPGGHCTERGQGDVGLGLGSGGSCMVRSNASWVMVTWDCRGQND